MTIYKLSKKSLILGCLLIGLIFGLSSAPAEAAEGDYDLALRAIESRPSTIRVGQETFFNITYVNDGLKKVPDDIEFYISLLVTDDETGEIIQSCSERVTSVNGLEPTQRLTYSFQSCDVIFRTEGAHTVRAAFVEDPDDAPQTGAFLALTDDADKANNGTVIPVDVAPFESALPEELGRLFAGLGMFFAVMALVAVGTEVVIDSAKVSLGMKSKATALEALAQMEKYMPGQLATLGVSTASQSEFRKLTASLKRTVIPVSEIPDIIEKVKSGDLTTAVATLKNFGIEDDKVQELLAGIISLQRAALTSLTEVQKELAELFRRLTEGLGQVIQLPLLTSEQRKFLQEIKTRVEVSTTKLNSLHLELIPYNIENLNELPNNLQAIVRDFKSLAADWQVLMLLVTHEVEKWSAQASAEWLADKRDEVLALGRQQVLDQFEKEVASQLRALEAFLTMIGFNNNLILEEAQRQVEHMLDLIENETISATDTYLYSLEKLMEGVEERRNLMQSPSRKLWRRLRESSNWYIWIPIGSGILVFLVLALFNLTIIGQIILSGGLNRTLIRVVGALIDGLLVGVAVLLVQFVLALLGKAIYERNQNSQIPKSGARSINGIEGIEIVWNWLRGDNIEPKRFGTAYEKKKKVRYLTVENAAQIVFERNDQQRDEESSRLRWLRVISFLIGFAIAYLLQVDAAELLDSAVPGIGITINRVLYISGDSLHSWQPWLSTERIISAGIILTAFAAAAGSSFWHDRLDQLQTSKKSAESAAKTLQLIEGINKTE